MRKTILSLSVIALTVAFGACKKSNPAPANAGMVMFVHGSAAGATTINLDGRANGTTVPGAANMPFLRNSGYQNVTAGSNIDFSFFVTGLNQLTNSVQTIAANTRYTAFAGGSVTAPTLVFSTDDLAAPAAGMAKVRFVNLCPNGLTTSCYVGLTKIDSNVAYKTCTPFYQVTAGTYKIGMIDQAVLTNSGQINTQVLAAGKIYTFMFTGTATGSGTSVLTLTAINNN